LDDIEALIVALWGSGCIREVTAPSLLDGDTCCVPTSGGWTIEIVSTLRGEDRAEALAHAAARILVRSDATVTSEREQELVDVIRHRPGAAAQTEAPSLRVVPKGAAA
jgi:hypothetical protein